MSFTLLLGYSQNVVVDQTTYTVEELITDVLINSPCANVSNITWSTGTDFGLANGIAYFSEPMGVFPFSEGLLISAGPATIANGPNNAYNQTGAAIGWPGDLDLSALSGTPTNNATIIEFDFVPIASEVTFRFAMGSEEYAPFAGIGNPLNDGALNYECDFSDVFGFFLTDQNGVTQNLALIPQTNLPVLVTSVHPDHPPGSGSTCIGDPNNYPQYFSQHVFLNDPPTGYDGFTRSITALATVNPGETYHIKLAVADATDFVVHSGVFLEAGSFNLGLDLGDDILISSGNAECDGDTVTLNTGSPTATHTWYKDGVEIVGETGPTLDVTDPGEYSVDVVFSASCQSSDSIIIEFVPNPVANPALNLNDCTGDFTLTLNNDDVLGGQNAADFTITYHETQADADNGANPLTSPYTALSNPQTVYARIESANNSSCFDTTSFEISIAPVTFVDPITALEVCDDDFDGFAQFTLTDRDNEVAASAGYAVGDVTISYHETSADATAGLNPLASPYTNWLRLLRHTLHWLLLHYPCP